MTGPYEGLNVLGGGIGRGRSIIPGGSTVRESPLNRKGFHGFRYFRLSTSSDFFPFDYILRNQTRLVQSIYRGAGGPKMLLNHFIYRLSTNCLSKKVAIYI